MNSTDRDEERALPSKTSKRWFAERAARLKASEIRELLKLLDRPGMRNHEMRPTLGCDAVQEPGEVRSTIHLVLVDKRISPPWADFNCVALR